MFAEKGYSGTSTKEIARKAGVAEGTIFRHYPTKKELLMAIITPTMIKMLAPVILKDLNKVLDKEFDHYEDFIREMIANRSEFLRKNRSTVRILIQEIPFHPELKEQFIEHVGNKVFNRYIEIIRHYQAKGQIIDMDPTTVLRFSASSIIGLFVVKYVFSPVDWNDEIETERTIELIKSALTPRG